MSRYRCVDAQKAAGFPVAAACKAAGVTRSGYYAWASAAHRPGPGERHPEQARLVAAIRAIHTDSGGTYGSPRVHAELGRRGWRVNRKRVGASCVPTASSAPWGCRVRGICERPGGQPVRRVARPG
jgi:putative transposase